MNFEQCIKAHSAPLDNILSGNYRGQKARESPILRLWIYPSDLTRSRFEETSIVLGSVIGN